MTSSSSESNVLDHRLADKLAGSSLLAAFGDAVALPRESAAVRGTAVRLQDVTWLPATETFHGGVGSDLGIWVPGDVARGMRGVTSDATAWRAVIFEPWLEEIADRDAEADTEETAGFGEAGLIAFLARSASKELEGEPEWRARRRRGQARLWREVHEVARGAMSSLSLSTPTSTKKAKTETEVMPWRKGAPAVLSTFLYLGAAPAFAGGDVNDVYRRFRDLSALDQGEAAVVTGTLAAMIAAATATSEDSVHPHYWFSENVREFLGARIEATAKDGNEADQNEHDALVRTRDAVHGMLGLGINLRRRDDAVFVAAMEQELARRRPDHALAPFDPLVVLRLVVGSLTYAAHDLTKAFRCLAACSGDVCMATTILGTYLGAYLGEKRLRDIMAKHGELDIDTVAATTTKLYDVTPQARTTRMIRFAENIAPGPT